MGMGLSICRSIIETLWWAAVGGHVRAAGVLFFSLRSPLTEPPSVIDVAYWHFSGTLRCLTSACNALKSGRASCATVDQFQCENTAAAAEQQLVKRRSF